MKKLLLLIPLLLVALTGCGNSEMNTAKEWSALYFNEAIDTTDTVLVEEIEYGHNDQDDYYYGWFEFDVYSSVYVGGDTELDYELTVARYFVGISWDTERWANNFENSVGKDYGKREFLEDEIIDLDIARIKEAN